jgi:very-short-patch-repair endonuclease
VGSQTAGVHLLQWIGERDGVAHRADILAAGFSVAGLRSFVRDGFGVMIRRAWVALPDADPALVLAARAGGRVSCVSLAVRRGWWIPDRPEAVHLHLLPNAGSAHVTGRIDAVLHWARPLAPTGRALVGEVEDALQHIATCRPREEALVLWESAARLERLAPDYLRSVAWTSVAARELAGAVNGLSDSGLETLLVTPLRRWGVLVRQQVVLAGRPVDILIGERLVIQIDGWQFHSSAAQRAKDIAHDAELRLRGYTVFRFGYAQVVHGREEVLRVIRRALASRLHLAA